MKKIWKDRLKFFFDFEELHFIFDKIILMVYFLFAGAAGGVVTVVLLQPVLNIELDNSKIGITVDLLLSSAGELLIRLAFITIAFVLVFRMIFLGIGKLIELWIYKKQVKEDASL
ncbi:hypothetical protein ACNQFZ_06550 [Schinkia sp. CFF1]